MKEPKLMAMQNGTYEARMRASNTKGVLRVKNGVIRWFVDGKLMCLVKDIGLYEVLGKVKGEEGLYDVEWWVGGKLMETIPMRAKYGVCQWKINQLKGSTHRSGKLIIVPYL